MVFFIAVLVGVLTIRFSHICLRIGAMLSWGMFVTIIYSLFAMMVHPRPSDWVDLVMFVVFLTYTMIPLSLRVSTVLSAGLCVFHIIVSTAVATADVKNEPGIIARQVSMRERVGGGASLPDR